MSYLQRTMLSSNAVGYFWYFGYATYALKSRLAWSSKWRLFLTFIKMGCYVVLPVSLTPSVHTHDSNPKLSDGVNSFLTSLCEWFPALWFEIYIGICTAVINRSTVEIGVIFKIINYFTPGMYEVYCYQRVCVSVCFSVRSHISKVTWPNFTKFSVLVTFPRGSVFLWRQWNMLCTSGVVDDIIFSNNGAEYGRIKGDAMFRRVCQVAAPGRSLLSTIALRIDGLVSTCF